MDKTKMDNTKTKTKMDNTKPKPKPRWFSGPIFPKYNDPKPANFEYKPIEKLHGGMIYLEKSNYALVKPAKFKIDGCVC